MILTIIVYNYPPKGRWIVGAYTDTRSVEVHIYIALWTDREGDSCFSIYQISWIKIKTIFFNKRWLRCNWRCSKDLFLWCCCKFRKKCFFYRSVNADKPNFVSFLVFVGAAASFTPKMSSFETVAKREAILNPVPKQWISNDVPSYRSQSELARIAIHWFGE